jgi:glycosyltransferase involved in cell wall biosynthesis
MGFVRFSFIVPTFNEEKNLDGCLNSLINQTRDDYEVIVVDGGSRDGTREIAMKYGVDFVVVPKRRPHDVSFAKNEGMRRSSGVYVFFLDADMVLDPNCIEVLEDIFSDREVIGVSLKVLPWKGTPFETFLFSFNNVLVAIAHSVKFYQLSYFSCHCYRKDMVETVEGFREDLNSCEDLDLSLRMARLGRYMVTGRTTLWTSPRRLREWSYGVYVLRYCKFLFQYYLLNKINDFYEDMDELIQNSHIEIKARIRVIEKRVGN